RSAAMVGASARYGPVPAAKAAYAAGYAWRQAERLHGKAYDHVLAYWGNYAASAAAFFHAATRPEIPYSMFVHARMDLYRHPAWLEQKLLYADNIFVVCEYNRRYLAQRYPAAYPRIADRIHVHHLGMPLDEVAFAPAELADNQLVAVGYHEQIGRASSRE